MVSNAVGRYEIAMVAELLLPNIGTLISIVILALIAGVVLSPLEVLFPAKVQSRPWRKEFALDVIYWFMTPLMTRTISALVIAGLFLIVSHVAGIHVDTGILKKGWGPVGSQPLWLQIFEILVVVDLVDYWSHRTLHKPRFWKIHAIHHTPEDMTWISSARVHPLNDLITRSAQVMAVLPLGFSAQAVLDVLPFISFYVMFLHSNISWDFGPFRYLLVSPAYHRWHHTSDDEGLDKNYAGIFPIWDKLFGTQHFPNYLPVKYGLKSGYVEESLGAHLRYPFQTS